MDQKENVNVVIEEDKQENSVVRFLFDNHGVRGEIVHLHEPLQKLLEHKAYPLCIKKLLIQLATATSLIAATLKADGLVTVQIQGGKGDKALNCAFINIDKNLNFYGGAYFNNEIQYTDDVSFNEMVGEDGILVISAFPENGVRYQGIVPLTSEQNNLSQAIEEYFKNSAQLSSKFIIREDVDNLYAGGLMLQIIPEIEGNQESLEHLNILGSTLSIQELSTLSLNECLRRLYWNDQVRVFEPKTVDFKCVCSQEKTLQSLKSLGLEELYDMYQDQSVEDFTITCQSCGRQYVVTKEQIQRLIDTLEQEQKEKAQEAQEQEEEQNQNSCTKCQCSEQKDPNCIEVVEK